MKIVIELITGEAQLFYGIVTIWLQKGESSATLYDFACGLVVATRERFSLRLNERKENV